MAENNFDSWREQFKVKQIHPSNLKELIAHGSRIFIGTACSEPIIFTQELINQQEYWTDCELIHFLTLSKQKYFFEEHPTWFRHNTLSIIGSAEIRKAINAGNSDFTPIKSSDIPRLLKSHAIRVDIALIQISPPDQYGFCSLGIDVDINRIVVQEAKTVIAQINPQMPKTNGNSSIKFSLIDYFYFYDSPLLEFQYNYSKIKPEILEKLGHYLARLIENNSTLNIGLGKIPNNIWSFLSEKKDLAIYTEVLVLTDDLLKLVKSGIISCAKNYYPHIRASFAIGRNTHYQFLNQNSFFEFHSSEIINNLENITRNHKMCSIYSAIAVDLSGQVTNHLQDSFYSGIGGEIDFIQGTELNPMGKNIIVLPSTTYDGNLSRVVSIVHRASLPASSISFVVTEWGIARLKGKSVRERALQLIGIAHPKFRKALLENAKKLQYLYKDQILPLTKDGVVVVYPERWEWHFQCTNDQFSPIFFRPVKPIDETLLQAFFYQMDEFDRILRFLTPKQTYTHEFAQFDVNIDYDSTMVIIGFAGDEEAQEVVAAGSYFRDPNKETNLAELAIMVARKYQHHGLGRHIFFKMIEIAQEKGVGGFFGELFLENVAIIHILHTLPYKVSFEYFEDTLFFSFRFKDYIPSKKSTKTPNFSLSDPFMEFKTPL